MTHRPVRQILALFLAVFVTVGMSLSAVQASDMAAKMTMSSDMSGSSDDGCQGCPAGGGDDGAMASCPPNCMAPVLALLPHAPSVAGVFLSPLQPAAYPVLSGRTAWPDPYPPKPSDLG